MCNADGWRLLRCWHKPPTTTVGLEVVGTAPGNGVPVPQPVRGCPGLAWDACSLLITWVPRGRVAAFGGGDRESVPSPQEPTHSPATSVPYSCRDETTWAGTRTLTEALSHLTLPALLTGVLPPQGWEFRG